MDQAGVTDLRSVPAFSEEGVNLGEIVGKEALEALEAKAEVSVYVCGCWRIFLSVVATYHQTVSHMDKKQRLY